MLLQPALVARMRRERPLWALTLALSAALAVHCVFADSVTIDEPSHLLAGVAPFESGGDFRLAPDHPPLARFWMALPLLVQRHQPIDTASASWSAGDFATLGRSWLEQNGAYRLVRPARLMNVLLLLALVAAVGCTARALFGKAAGLAALALAAFDPGLLAHGHLVTTDVAAALFFLLALLGTAAYFSAPGPRALLGASAALAAASVIKFSWMLVLPALVAMALVALLQRTARWRAQGAGALVALLAIYGAIWSVYGWRYAALHDPSGTALMELATDVGRPAARTLDEAWDSVLHDPLTGGPRHTAVAAFARAARAHRLLPEAYIYGMAFAEKKGALRSAYLNGDYSMRGWPSYFPIAFAVKTPLATQALLLAGLVAAALAARGSSPSRDGGTSGGARRRLLAVGLFIFALTYGWAALSSHLNIGWRHLLPLHAVLLVVAGAAASFRGRWPRALVAAALAALLVTTARAHSQELAYFNEFAGGAPNGHRYLADSNLDWGQDLLRLADYAKRHPEERLLLAQFGDGFPPDGFAPERLLRQSSSGPLAALGEGTYALSPTLALGVYIPLLRDSAWEDPELLERYRELTLAGQRDPGSDRAGAELLDVLRRARLVERLRHRPADARVGTLFLHRLSASEVEQLLAP